MSETFFPAGSLLPCSRSPVQASEVCFVSFPRPSACVQWTIDSTFFDFHPSTVLLSFLVFPSRPGHTWLPRFPLREELSLERSTLQKRVFECLTHRVFLKSCTLLFWSSSPLRQLTLYYFPSNSMSTDRSLLFPHCSATQAHVRPPFCAGQLDISPRAYFDAFFPPPFRIFSPHWPSIALFFCAFGLSSRKHV